MVFLKKFGFVETRMNGEFSPEPLKMPIHNLLAFRFVQAVSWETLRVLKKEDKIPRQEGFFPLPVPPQQDIL
jgi:hypothetical protein